MEYILWVLLCIILLLTVIIGVVEYRKNRKEFDYIVSVGRDSTKKRIDCSEIGDISVFYDRKICKCFGWISIIFLVMFVIFTVFDIVFNAENAREDSYVMLSIFLIFQVIKYNYMLYRVSWVGGLITVYGFLRKARRYNISDIDQVIKTNNWYSRVIYVGGKKVFKVNFLCVNSGLFDRKLEAYGKIIKERGEK